jgi:uncharacterized repeat protein (TIGR01451 family)
MAGCASWQGPRIDPSGQRILIWPNERPPAAVVPPLGAPVIAAPPVTSPGAPLVAPPPAIGVPFGNVQAPPVYTDPSPVPLIQAPAPGGYGVPFPAAPAAPPVITGPAPPLSTVPAPAAVGVPVAPLPITPVVPVGTPNVATPLGLAAPAGVDYLRISPAGILAPVGSQVVLKAGICRADGYLVANQRVQWMLDRSGVGLFGETAGREPLFSMTRWHGPQVIDPWNAASSSANAPVRLTRGTADPADDVEIVRGDAWVSVTSATEGTSRITAYTTAISNWNRAMATIYWLDAQWVYPPSAAVEAGRPHTLMTSVTRRTDGAPLAGWLVRYEAAPGASLGYEGGNVVEVPTDANGRASVEVSPAGLGGGTTSVGITIVRPPQQGPHPTPRLEIGRGSATISWGGAITPAAPATPVTPPPMSAPASPYTPAPVTPPPVSTSPSEPQPVLPSDAGQADPYMPPADEPPPGRPQLELQLRRTGPEQVGVGEFASFEVTITNRGTGAARGIRLRDRFDTGLRHPSAKPNEYAVEYPDVRDLPPNESTTIPLSFQVVAGGTHCHEVTVSVEGAEPVSERGCITARQAVLEVTVTAPRTRVVGEVAQFNVVVKNVGEVAATNVEIINRYDAALEPHQAPAGHERLADGSILLRIDRLEASERRTFVTTANCRTRSDLACNRAIVTADGGITAAAEGCLEILPIIETGPVGEPQAALRLTISESKNPARVGERQIVYVTLQNAGQQVERQVSLRVLLPQEMTTDPAQVQPQQGLRVVGQELQFALDELPAQGQQRFTIPVTANRVGTVQIRAAAIAAGMNEHVTADSNRIEILTSSL